MTSEQESRLSMFMAVRDFLTANATITATLPNYAGYFTAVQNGITSIQTIREQQEFDKTGIAANKNQLKTTLISQAMDVSRKVVAYALYVNNTVLLNEVKYSETDLKKSADTILKDKSQVIYDRANTNLAALATYGITAAILTNLLTAITNYNAAIPKPRLGINDKKQATAQLAVLLDTVDSNLLKIDSLAEIVRLTQVNFYNGYKNARRIVETGIGSLALRGSAIETQNGEPVTNATFTFNHNGGTLKTAMASSSLDGNGTIVKKTAAKGNFNIKSMPEGTYSVTVTKPGYKDKVVTVSVTNGELCDLVVEMERA
jgi:hypothetical protein